MIHPEIWHPTPKDYACPAMYIQMYLEGFGFWKGVVDANVRGGGETLNPHLGKELHDRGQGINPLPLTLNPPPPE